MTPASRVLVLGGGPIGALLFTILKLRNHDSAKIVEPSEYRRVILSRIGPQRVFGNAAGEFDVVFDCSGSERAIARLLDGNLARQAQVVVENEWRIAGSSVFTDELPEAVRLVEEHWRELAPIVTQKFCFIEEQQITENIRDIRNRVGVTLDKLSSKVGITKSTLSKIERGKASTPINTLIKIAKALGVDISEFFIQRRERPAYVHTRKGLGQIVTRDGSRFGYTYEALASEMVDKSAEPFLCTVDKDDKIGDFQHAGEERVFSWNCSAPR